MRAPMTPARRLVLRVVVTYVGVVAALSLAGMTPSLLLLGAVALGLLSTGLGAGGATPTDAWPPMRTYVRDSGRGSDHATTHLARRLESVASSDPTARAALATGLHRALADVVWARAAAGASVPPQLAHLLTGPPDVDELTDPAALARLLSRIEAL